tara:strand:- start:56 stop:283 length:228 start_codon:yes stop_codon:yes gene_type:complete
MLTEKQLNLLCHSFDFIALISVTVAVISATIKHEKQVDAELKQIENAIGRERTATIVAISVASLSFLLKIYSHFR